MRGIVATHASNFHCDDVSASVLLGYTNLYRHHRLIRTLDPIELNRCDLVFDIGGVYDPDTNRYDHHQKGFVETYSSQHTIRLSSCGLIYKHFGKEIIANVIDFIDPFGEKLTADQLSWLELKIYNSFIIAIDANDNGIDPYDGTPLFRDSTTLPARVAKLNSKGNGMLRMEQFMKAQELVRSEFIEFFSAIYFKVIPSLPPVSDVFKTREKYDAEGRILVFKNKCNWRDFLEDLETEEALKTGKLRQVLYVVSFDDTRGQWGCIAVPIAQGSFKMRKPFPLPWRGLRDEKMSEVTGVEGSVFTHNSGFLCCHKTYDGMLKLTQLACAFKD
ncbi:hypothetical protein EIN_409160 [Entamoeba invadens IP1]|uniref:Metal-dependent protein hydrolase n=1 Tax=Entamoeba invadens IP1 TaxID=370355 RepID=A0A0A1TWQ3_ENTIV|nr:hypothetical protein EIN_409160 [Entamoeba invadens IP1]ELP85627.1 hypothetical protein EIN_409160 [Entamoeba invadens IP1]|eukprot:XP_004184973.1 hypothetical protein EIN_409160 [Entamoeba invadens IP1]